MSSFNSGCSTCICDMSCLSPPIKLIGKDNEVRHPLVVCNKSLSLLESLKCVELINHLQFFVDGFLPKIVLIGFVQFQNMFGISWDDDSKHRLDSIDTGFVHLNHWSHPLLTLQEVFSLFPIWLLGQLFLHCICNEWI